VNDGISASWLQIDCDSCGSGGVTCRILGVVMHVSFLGCNSPGTVWTEGKRSSILATVWLRGITLYNKTTNNNHL